MSREVKSDFLHLMTFIKDYTLEPLTYNSEFVKNLSQQHKKYFAYLTILAEFKYISNDQNVVPIVSIEQISYITESCSDIGSALFCMAHGAYKASKIMLRSSIETFHKGFNIDQIADINTETSIFNLFNRIKTLPFFLTNPQKEIFNVIHQEYKTLCQDTHTATNLNMQNVTALKYFPTFSPRQATDVSDSLVRLVTSYNSLLCIKYNSYFHRIHFKNKEIILKNVPKQVRRIIQGID